MNIRYILVCDNMREESCRVCSRQCLRSIKQASKSHDFVIADMSRVAISNSNIISTLLQFKDNIVAIHCTPKTKEVILLLGMKNLINVAEDEISAMKLINDIVESKHFV